MTQRELARRVGITGQRMFYYETGRFSVSAGVLYEIARALDTATDYFYDGLGAGPLNAPLPPRSRLMHDLMETLVKIESKTDLRAVLQLTREFLRR